MVYVENDPESVSIPSPPLSTSSPLLLCYCNLTSVAAIGGYRTFIRLFRLCTSEQTLPHSFLSPGNVNTPFSFNNADFISRHRHTPPSSHHWTPSALSLQSIGSQPQVSFYCSSHYYFLRVIHNIICSPFYKVLMVYFFTAGQLTRLLLCYWLRNSMVN